MRALGVLLLAAAIAAGTMMVGWYAVPVLAAVYALVMRSDRAMRHAALAAAIAWTGLLARAMQFEAFGRLLSQLGQIFPMPGPVVAALTVLLAVILAVTAARVVTGVVGVKD
ncbi:MAG: hypothetical protein IT354_17625 [Gemmatimonadaceae bacterium]|nr:hypothetical protein [Gemmatimonadaceae bacterium]